MLPIPNAFCPRYRPYPYRDAQRLFGEFWHIFCFVVSTLMSMSPLLAKSESSCIEALLMKRSQCSTFVRTSVFAVRLLLPPVTATWA